MKEQLPHAIKSFKSQKHITISMVKAKVEVAFNNASDKEHPAWLIQWVIDNKLVCDIIFNVLFQALIYILIRITNSLFVSQWKKIKL